MTLPTTWTGGTMGGSVIPEVANHCLNPKPIHAAASLPSNWYEYGVTGATFEYSSGGTVNGRTSKHVKITGGAGVSTLSGLVVKNAVNSEIAEGQTVTASLQWGEATITGCSVAIVIAWYKDDDTAISTDQGPSLGDATSFVQKSHAAVAPALATKYKILVRAAGNFSEGDIQEYSIAEVLITQTVSATPEFFDGDSIGGRWTGDRDASISYRDLCRPVAGTWVIEDTDADHETVIRSPGFAVVAGRYYGAMGRVTMDEVVGGTFSLDIIWYDEDDVYIEGESVSAWLTSAAAEHLYGNAYQAPRGATQALVRVGWNGDTSATGDCKATVEDIRFGAGVGRAPIVLPCGDQQGDGPAPWHLTADASTGELAALYAGRYPDETADDISLFAIEAVDLTWTGGASASDSAGYPAGGTSCWKVQSATEESAPVTVPDDLLEGDYLPVFKVKHDSGGTATIRRQGQSAVSIPGTTLGLLPLGVMHLKPGDTFNIYLAGDGTHYGWFNALFFVPQSFGGAVGWRDTVGHAHTLEWSDDLLLVDGVPDLSKATVGRQIIGLGGMLVVVAEKATPAAYTPLSVGLDLEPHWEQLPSA